MGKRQSWEADDHEGLLAQFNTSALRIIGVEFYQERRGVTRFKVVEVPSMRGNAEPFTARSSNGDARAGNVLVPVADQVPAGR